MLKSFRGILSAILLGMVILPIAPPCQADVTQKASVQMDSALTEQQYAAQKVKALRSAEGLNIDLTFLNLVLKDKVAAERLAKIALEMAVYPRTREVASYILNHNTKHIDAIIQAEKIEYFPNAPYWSYNGTSPDSF